MKSLLLFTVIIVEVFAGTQRDSRYLFGKEGGARIKEADEIKEDPETSLMELLTGLASSALPRLMGIATLENLINSLPVATVYNTFTNTSISQIRDDPSEISGLLAHIFVTALHAAHGPENLPPVAVFMKMAIKTYIEIYVALFHEETEEEKRQLKKYLVRALSRGNSGEIRGLTIKANGQTLLSPRSTLSTLGWFLENMPDIHIPLIVILQTIPIMEIDSKLREFDFSPESVDELADFLTGVGMDLLVTLGVDPEAEIWFTQEYIVAELIKTKIQLMFALYDLVEGKPEEEDTEERRGEAVVKRLLLNALA